MRYVTGSFKEQIDAVLSNCAAFDHVGFTAWLMTKPAIIRKTAQRTPPDRLYRCHLGAKGLPTYGYIEAYLNNGDVVVRPIGLATGTLTLPPGALEDVTAIAQTGALEPI